MALRTEIHSHSEYSNLRLLDATNRLPQLVDYAAEIGLAGIALTDHETVAGAVQWKKQEKRIREKYPNFKCIIGNEIYLKKERDMGRKYPHFILLAKDKEGFRQLRILSSIAWMNSYFDRRMERVVTLREDIEKIIGGNPGHVIASTACLAGTVNSNVLVMENARRVGDLETAERAKNEIIEFVLWCKEIFGEDFYLEVAPAANKEQIIVNKKVVELSQAFGAKMVIGCDAHYLKKEDAGVHEAFLNSKGGERETKDFYEYAYLQTEEEIKENLTPSIVDLYEDMCANSMEIFDKIEDYYLDYPQQIPKVVVPFVEKGHYTINGITKEEYPILYSMGISDDNVERYWLSECLNALVKKHLIADKRYLEELELEAKIKRIVGERLKTNMFYYPITLKYYIDMIWECGSPVGPGRGSAPTGLNHWLLGITQLDPIKYGQQFRRYMNEGTHELGDIDIDISPSKRPYIIDQIKKERGSRFNEDIDDLSRRNLGAALVATFGTATTKKAIQIACKGYRSEECMDGIDIDTSQYISSLVPSERGFVWSLKDCYYGNPEKGRKPISQFINAVDSYPGLFNIMIGIEGCIVSRSSHASGVIFVDEDPYQFGAFMRTPSGDIITQFDLHDCESIGMTKYDLLVTSAMDKLTQAIKFLQEDNKIDPSLSLREVYEKYFHPDVLNFEDEEVWDSIKRNDVLDLFQFDSVEGGKGIKSIQPDNLTELSNVNGLIRLVAPEGSTERPIEKYQRFKANPQLWYDEMKSYGLTEENVKTLEKYYKTSYGISISQENFLFSLGDEGVCGWDFSRCNDARRVISKKKMDKLPILKQEIIKDAATPELGRYYWDHVVLPISSYAFSDPHALAYGMVAYQMAYIATKWNPLYWTTACLVVNSESLEIESNDLNDDEQKKKNRNCDYGRIASAISRIKQNGVEISLININTSDYGFKPDVENNRILYGLKPLSNINEETIEQIKAGRPYIGIKDFMNRCPLGKKAMINLIKAGAFDEVETELSSRKEIMAYYIYKVCGMKTRLTLQNWNGLVQSNLVPKNLELQIRIFNFNKYIKTYCKVGQYYQFNDICMQFFEKFMPEVLDSVETINGAFCMLQKDWDKIYQAGMDVARDWVKDNQVKILKKYNASIFKEMWDKYAEGNYSHWEMDSVCFYHGEHELENIDYNKYGLSDFNNLRTDDIEYYFKRGNLNIPIYNLHRIAGTVLDKNDTKNYVVLLTKTGVVNVKLSRDQYAKYKKRISEIQPDGSKKIVEQGWFTRGRMLMFTGYKSDDITFRVKTYKNTMTHQIYLIEDVIGDEIKLRHERVNGIEEDYDE